MSLLFRITLLASLPLMLTACERSDYTTWHCQATDRSEKKTFILDRAKLIIEEQEFKYCGSLGKMSYFDRQCLGHAGAESVQLTPETGELRINEKTYQCKVL